MEIDNTDIDNGLMVIFFDKWKKRVSNRHNFNELQKILFSDWDSNKLI